MAGRKVSSACEFWLWRASIVIELDPLGSKSQIISHLVYMSLDIYLVVSPLFSSTCSALLYLVHLVQSTKRHAQCTILAKSMGFLRGR